MPFKSQAQRRWMYAKHPEMAAEWEAETPEGADLPEHVSDSPITRAQAARMNKDSDYMANLVQKKVFKGGHRH